MVLGLAATSLMLLEKEGMLDALRAGRARQARPAMRDPADPPQWVGMDVWASAFCFNTVEAGNKSLPAPTSWADLTKPEYKGQVVMPNPASSGHRLPDGLGLAADDGRGEGLGVHGRPAPEHRRLHPFGLQALPAGGCRRVRDRPLVRVSRQQDQERRRADRDRPAEGGPGLGHGGDRHHEDHQAARGGEEAGRLGGDAGSQRALRPELRHRGAARHRQAARARARATSRRC